MNGVRVLTMIDSAKSCVLVTGACQSSQANFYLQPICNRQIVCNSYFGIYGSSSCAYGLKNTI